MAANNSNNPLNSLTLHKKIAEDRYDIEVNLVDAIELIYTGLIHTLDDKLKQEGVSRYKREKAIADFKQQLTKKDSAESEKLFRIASDRKRREYDKLSIYDRKLAKQADIAKLESQKKLTEQMLKDKRNAAAQLKRLEGKDDSQSNKKREAAQKKLDNANKFLKEQSDSGINIQAINSKLVEFNKQLEQLESLPLSTADRLKQSNDALDALEQERIALEQQRLDVQAATYEELSEQEKEQLEAQLKKDLQANKAKTAAEKAKNKQLEAKAKREEAKQEAKDERLQAKEDLKAQFGTSEGWGKMLDEVSKNLQNAVKNLASTQDITDTLNEFYKDVGKYEARLEGSGKDFTDMLGKASKTIGISGIISQKSMADSIRKLVESGVDYNLELRAYLATVNDNIIHTFDAFDGNLMRLIRLQQKDSTAARMGMESVLNQLLHSMFQDSSYLGSSASGGVADSVSQAISDASALLSHDMALEFEYMAQKWLGALYSVGVSDSFISMVAKGLNLLGTGNVDAIAGDDSLQTLLALSAVQSGQQYGDLLTGGMDPSQVNNLMRGMLEYLGQIATNTEGNNVLKTAYGNVFGVTSADLKAITNLTSDTQTIKTLYNNTLNYNQALAETTNQLNAISGRLTLSQKLDTAIENIKTQTALNIGSNQATYSTWQALQIIEDYTGGIGIPSIGVLGNFLDINDTVTGLGKGVIAGLSLLSTIVGGLGNIGAGPPGLSVWGSTESVSRGTTFDLNYRGVQSGISRSDSIRTVVNSDSESYYSNLLQDAADNAEEVSEITNETVDEATRESEEFHDKTLEYLKDIRDVIKDELSPIIKSTVVYETTTTQNNSLIGKILNSEEAINNSSVSNTSSDKAARLKVELAEISDSSKQAIQGIIHSMFSSSGASGQGNSDDTLLDTFIDKLRKEFDGLPVTIQNDYIDDALQITALGGI